MTWTVFAFYKFFDLPHPERVREQVRVLCDAQGICGTVLLAEEGINGTVAGPAEGIEAFLTYWDSEVGGMEGKFSFTEEKPFGKLKVKVKKEIVTLRRPDLRPHRCPVGTHIDPADWNKLISDPEVRVIDTRNDFECKIGTFERAENPGTTAFHEFPAYVSRELDPAKDKKVAMFCTGGIRCEKATALLLEQGFTEVYHLKGGILNYLKEIPESESLWRGECFVFDERVALNHTLAPGTATRSQKG
jgi:UPF0176 protein